MDSNILKPKLLPYNVQAERLLLGAILRDNKVYYNICPFILKEHFYDEINQKIYQAIQSVIEDNLIATPVSVKTFLDSDEAFDEVGAENFLAQLTLMGITVFKAEDYASIVYDLAIRRNLIELCEKTLDTAYNSSLENIKTKHIIQETENKLFSIAEYGYIDKGFKHVREIADQTLTNIFKAYELNKNNQIVGLSTGFSSLNQILGGLHNSDLIILAGRPGMGKTAFAINLAINVAEQFATQKENQKSIGIFSLEMSSEQLITRMLSMSTNIDSMTLKSGYFSKNQHVQISNSVAELSKFPIFINDTPGLSISAIRAKAKQLKRKHNLGFLVIDYLQLVHGSRNFDNRVLEISEITKGLKELARELHIPILVLSQLSRAVEQRIDKKPLLSDLRESGSIEQDADIVMFLYRQGYYDRIANKHHSSRGINDQGNDEEGRQQNNTPSDSSVNKNVLDRTELIVAKHRHGPVGAVELYYDLSASKFSGIVKFDPTN